MVIIYDHKKIESKYVNAPESYISHTEHATVVLTGTTIISKDVGDVVNIFRNSSHWPLGLD